MKRNEKKHSFRRVVENNMFILKYAFGYTPFFIIAAISYAAIADIVVFFEHTYCTKYLLDVIQYQKPFRLVVQYIGIMSAIVAIKIFLNAFYVQVIEPKGYEKLRKHIRMDLYEKAVEMDLACYDDPDYYNEFVWSTGEASKRVETTISYMYRLSGSLASLLACGALIIASDGLGIVFVLASFVLVTITNMALNKLKYQMEVELKPKSRKQAYINRVFYLTDYAKELRMNPISKKLKKEFDETNQEILDTIDRHTKKQVFLAFLSRYLFNDFIMDGLYMVYLIFKTTVQKVISYGTMIALLRSAWGVKRSLMRMTNLLPEFQQNSLYIERIRIFLDYEKSIKDPEGIKKPLPQEAPLIELKNVSFSYNGKDPVLKNINLTIKPYEKIAFVGYNGAGKTTLTKLLMRLYDVSQGEIKMNHANIKEYGVEEYRNCYGAVFQDYQMVAATIGENVMMDHCMDAHRGLVHEALEKSGFSEKLSSLKEDIDTPLTREFEADAVNLSGGEAQKVAIARVFAKPCQVIILDEPSSALDPISEYHLNASMAEAAENKTVIYISHRLSSTRMADRIYMLDRGEIVEEGNHEELMALNGKYAYMFNLQAEKYRMNS